MKPKLNLNSTNSTATTELNNSVYQNIGLGMVL